MKQPIIGFKKDEENHWVAMLQCCHGQHVRHMPPFISRPWVVSKKGRDAMLGHELACKKCDDKIVS